MYHAPRSHRPSGFTLIELLVVVIILAILAAIVIPQFSSATTDTQEASLDANLGGMRNAIELYKVQHNKYPGAVAATGASCPNSGVAGTGAIDTEQAVKDQLLMYTNAAGQACSIGDGVFKFGPYLRKGIPADPVKQVATIVVTKTGAPLAPSADTGGWAYDNVSGQIVMNSNANDSRSKPYSSH